LAGVGRTGVVLHVGEPDPEADEAHPRLTALPGFREEPLEDRRLGLGPRTLPRRAPEVGKLELYEQLPDRPVARRSLEIPDQF